jgi:hypothetical protein
MSWTKAHSCMPDDLMPARRVPDFDATACTVWPAGRDLGTPAAHVQPSASVSPAEVARCSCDPPSTARQVGPGQTDSLAAYCFKWLGGEDPNLRRAAALTLGLLAEVEGARFGRRMKLLLPPLTAVLRWQAVNNSSESEVDVGAELLGNCPRWQEGYACLVLLEKVAAKVGARPGVAGGSV